MKYSFNVVIQKEENWYVAKCAENSVASQGETLEGALANLKEAIELYYEDNAAPVLAVPTFFSTLEVSV